ncbi:hypothetical protein K7X08_004012 [Anisodus acutangulus]|uniref:Uncharacterized protein n=1 Tax=Anisodus acutangulus TaxID=402998 RepID=A0A9Q1MHX0_9SOLA|nr:hypothetical protein K7X08_004012 [Anisodus acutangulus]
MNLNKENDKKESVNIYQNTTSKRDREKSLIFLLCKLLLSFQQISEMEIGLAVGSAFLSSALNVLFDRLTPKGDLMKMFQTDNPDFVLLEKLRRTLRGLKIVENK